MEQANYAILVTGPPPPESVLIAPLVSIGGRPSNGHGLQSPRLYAHSRLPKKFYPTGDASWKMSNINTWPI